MYGHVARLRRSWYERHPRASRHLDSPVISVGNLVVGGSGKTPVVAAIAQMLLDAGQRPAILTRGYGRRRRADGVVVVSDGESVLAPVDLSGDEPQMLAHALRRVPVLVAADRYLAGRLAERQFGANVMILDDGFQHLGLARDVNLLLVAPGDLDERVLPSGRLREPLTAGRSADAVLVSGTADDAARVAATLGVATAFTVTRRYGALRLLDGTSGHAEDELAAGAGPPAPGSNGAATAVESDIGRPEPVLSTRWRARGASNGREGRSSGDMPMPESERLRIGAPGTRVVAVAGIARPERFLSALRDQEWELVGEMTFRDHHWFTAADIARIVERARGAQADAIVTTAKDAVRLESLLVREGSKTREHDGPPWMVLPVQAAIEPVDGFSAWLLVGLQAGALRGTRARTAGQAESRLAGTRSAPDDSDSPPEER